HSGCDAARVPRTADGVERDAADDRSECPAHADPEFAGFSRADENLRELGKGRRRSVISAGWTRYVGRPRDDSLRHDFLWRIHPVEWDLQWKSANRAGGVAETSEPQHSVQWEWCGLAVWQHIAHLGFGD